VDGRSYELDNFFLRIRLLRTMLMLILILQMVHSMKDGGQREQNYGIDLGFYCELLLNGCHLKHTYNYYEIYRIESKNKMVQ
jgi:hypothetical protein